MRCRYIIGSATGVAALLFSANAIAEVPFKMGMTSDISVPSGIALGPEVRLPYFPWFKFGASATYSLSFGARGNILFDPIKFPVAPILNIDIGHQFPFAIPTVKNSPNIDFTYADLQAGISFGRRDGFRFMLLGGMSYVVGVAHNFQGIFPITAGLTISDPKFTGWMPNAKLGFSLLF